LARSLEQLLQDEVRAAGFELYDWSLKPAGKRGRLLRVSLHSDEGVNLDDCADVSRRLSRALEAEELIRGRYILEVSSPGMDRPLLHPRHFEIALGRVARIQLSTEDRGRRDLEGRIMGLEDGDLILEITEREERIPMDRIAKARLVPQFPGRRRKSAGSSGGKK